MRTMLAGCLLMAATLALGQIPEDVSLEPVLGEGELKAPLGVKHAGDGSGRLFIVEQGGAIRVLTAEGSLLTTPFIDIGSLITLSGERGLLDIAFHPQFGSNGRFYLHYSAGTNRPAGTQPGDTLVAQFSVTANPNIASSTPDRIILTVRQDFSNHNGGQMRFGPDGYLYIGLGDGGSSNDPCNRSQTLDPAAIMTDGSCSADRSVALLGKMLRIDVDRTTKAGANNLCAARSDGSAEYAVPTENPFADQLDRCGEVLFYGLRNPWRWSFDRETQDLWIGDVGQNTWEEVSRVPWPLAGGENLGWNICEGRFMRGSVSVPCSLASSLLPILSYRTGQDGNCSITGGYRYRGPVTSLRGRYVFGDFCSGRVWFARRDNASWTAEVFGSAGGNIRSFGEDEAGNLYVLANSTLQRFNGMQDVIFTDGFER
ncbi:MAG: PQQ-dependent sugar dehydrogenase [Wenzhouxiangellaceae bacterium]|nr:PQQ-dependent sugar dehydrogenase [Wenzhouxiangellaceae bacterium]